MNPLGQSDILPLRSVLLKHARDAFVDQPTLDASWENLAYLARPDFAAAVTEYEAFRVLLTELGAEVHMAPADPETGPDSVYVRDSAVICDRGAILCNMGKPARDTEPTATERALRSASVPIVGRITGSGRLEGGDVAWIDDRNVAVGLGYRTNAVGIRQLRALLGSEVDRVVPVPLPHWHGPEDVFHLMSMYSPVDHDLAVVYSPLLPVPFRQLLLKKGYELVEVPEEEFESMGCNVLAVAPRKCVVVEGNPVTRRRLEAAGAEVHEYKGREISMKGGGGPTCLTRPLVRSE
jgi:N-dimethylarginine dimethylaminohydrolase